MSKEHKKKQPCNCKADAELKATRDFLKHYGGVEAELGTEPKWKTYLRYYTVKTIAILLIPFLFIYVVFNLLFNVLTGKGRTVTIKPLEKYLKQHNG